MIIKCNTIVTAMCGWTCKLEAFPLIFRDRKIIPQMAKYFGGYSSKY